MSTQMITCFRTCAMSEVTQNNQYHSIDGCTTTHAQAHFCACMLKIAISCTGLEECVYDWTKINNNCCLEDMFANEEKYQ